MDRKIKELPGEYVLLDGKIGTEGFSREVDKMRKRKKHKGLAIVGIATTLVVAISYNVAGSFAFDNAMLREQSTTKIVSKADDRNAFDNDFHNPIPMESHLDWFKELEKEEVSIKSKDGLKLNAYEIINPVPTNKWIITLHGYRGNAEWKNFYAYHFYNEGYNLLIPNARGCGSSEGNYIEMGYADRLDVLQWIQRLVDRDPSCQIVLHGVSMGGATVMMTTGEKLPSNVKAAVEDCGYTSVWEELSYVGHKGSGIPKGLINIALSSASLISKVKTGNYYSDMSAVKQLKKSTTPTLFIHGEEDSFVPFYMLDQVYNANDRIEKEKLVIPGAAHAYASTIDPDLYYSTIYNFINRYWDD